MRFVKPLLPAMYLASVLIFQSGCAVGIYPSHAPVPPPGYGGGYGQPPFGQPYGGAAPYGAPGGAGHYSPYAPGMSDPTQQGAGQSAYGPAGYGSNGQPSSANYSPIAQATYQPTFQPAVAQPVASQPTTPAGQGAPPSGPNIPPPPAGVGAFQPIPPASSTPLGPQGGLAGSPPTGSTGSTPTATGSAGNPLGLPPSPTLPPTGGAPAGPSSSVTVTPGDPAGPTVNPTATGAGPTSNSTATSPGTTGNPTETALAPADSPTDVEKSIDTALQKKFNDFRKSQTPPLDSLASTQELQIVAFARAMGAFAGPATTTGSVTGTDAPPLTSPDLQVIDLPHGEAGPIFSEKSKLDDLIKIQAKADDVAQSIFDQITTDQDKKKAFLNAQWTKIGTGTAYRKGGQNSSDGRPVIPTCILLGR